MRSCRGDGPAREWDEATCQRTDRWCSESTSSQRLWRGRLASGRRDATITGFTIDSRRVSPGDLFFAVRGERFDGHDFAADALDKGAVGVIVTDALGGCEWR